MEDDENPKLFHHPQRHSSSSSSMTLFSRLDHLDFVMKELEKKQRLERLFGESNLEEGIMGGRSISMDVALKDTYSKGSLLDRVAALEHRLLQLCLEMESGSSSNPSSLTTSSQTSSLEITSSSSPKKFCNGQTSSSSYPTFHYPNNGTTSQVSQFQEKPQRQQKKKQQSTPKGQVVVGKTMTENDEVGSCKNVKKGNPSAFKWPHLRMFGC